MTTGGYRVIVEGEDIVAAKLHRFAGKLEVGVKEADEKIAGKVAEDARSRAESIGGVAAHVAPSITSSDGQIDFGSGLPMAMGAEFGRNEYHQFSPWTGSGESAGYFLIPTVVSEQEVARREYEAALKIALRSA